MTERASQTSGQWPEQYVKAYRTVGDEETLAFVGYIAKAEPDGRGNLRVTVHAPEGLFAGRSLPFRPPMVERATGPAAFEFWWRLLDYIFGLPDPRTFPALPKALAEPEATIVRRYIETSSHLAESALLNSVGEGVIVKIDDDTDEEHVFPSLPARDIQVGFVALLRQCDSQGELASFQKVRNALWVANASEAGIEADERRATLAAWKRAMDQAHQRSVNQLLRDKLVNEEGLGVFDFKEPDSPAHLLSAFNYGDLIHWGTKATVVQQWERTDEFTAAERRMQFLSAAVGIAHLHIGFAEIARAAISEPAPAPPAP
jgi:hypothetical protein